MHAPNSDGTETARLHDSGLIERFQLDNGFVWSLTSTAINLVLDADTALQKLLQEIAAKEDVLGRYTAGIGLLYDVSLQTDVDGVWIAIDHARHVIGLNPDDRDSLALSAVVDADDETEGGLEQCMLAVASHPDRSTRQVLLVGLVRLVRREAGREELSAVARFLKGVA
jgi:hypothetical protein